MLLPAAKQPHGKSTRLALQAQGLPLIHYRAIWYKLQENIESAQIQELRRNKQRKSRFRGLSCKQSSKVHTFSPANAHFFTAGF